MSRPTKHSVLGGYLDEHVAEQRAKDPEFAAEFDRLSLARLVREARKAAHLTQAQLAARAGLKQPHIARIESGKVVPKLPMLQRISLAVGAAMEVRLHLPAFAQAKQRGGLTISAYTSRPTAAKPASRRKPASKRSTTRQAVVSRARREPAPST